LVSRVIVKDAVNYFFLSGVLRGYVLLLAQPEFITGIIDRIYPDRAL
jgi:hypothetical protein